MKQTLHFALTATLIAAPATAQVSGGGAVSGGTPVPSMSSSNSGDHAPDPARADEIRRGMQRVEDEYNSSGNQAREARQAKKDELVAGATVHDLKGQVLGTVASIEDDGAVVSARGGPVKVPLEAFGTSKKLGLVLSISKVDFEAAVAKSRAQ